MALIGGHLGVESSPRNIDWNTDPVRKALAIFPLAIGVSLISGKLEIISSFRSIRINTSPVFKVKAIRKLARCITRVGFLSVLLRFGDGRRSHQ
jgi:hypothetical protein